MIIRGGLIFRGMGHGYLEHEREVLNSWEGGYIVLRVDKKNK